MANIYFICHLKTKLKKEYNILSAKTKLIVIEAAVYSIRIIARIANK